MLERSLARGWRVVLRCGSEAGMAGLDAALWTYRDDAFLPHGTAAAGQAARQPVYLTLGEENPNGANVLMLVDGARATPAEMAGFERTCLIFDGGDAEAVAAARGDWRAVVAAGLPAIYWAREQGALGAEGAGGGGMIRIVGISGSLRAGSYNAALLREAVALAPAGSEIVVETIRGVPLYDGDVEAADGIPPQVARLKEAVAAADGLLLVTPEYNNGIPGVFKNAIDWMTRPAADIARVFGGRPVALIGASNGQFGTILAQNAWLSVLRTLRTDPWLEGRLMLQRAGSAFDAEGRLAEADRERLGKYLEGFAGYLARRRLGGNSA